jgi:hypothetical protein
MNEPNDFIRGLLPIAAPWDALDKGVVGVVPDGIPDGIPDGVLAGVPAGVADGVPDGLVFGVVGVAALLTKGVGHTKFLEGVNAAGFDLSVGTGGFSLQLLPNMSNIGLLSP